MGYFSKSYSQARKLYLKKAKQQQAQLFSITHPMLGQEGEELAMDVAQLGTGDSAIVTVSATHGVEGFYGSAVQSALMDKQFHKMATGVKMIHVHSLNPWGFSHLRRANENNIDVNRNFWTKPPTEFNAAYKKIEEWANPKGLSKKILSKSNSSIETFLKKRSHDELKVALFGGQTAFRDGQLYAGHGWSWSRLALEKVMRSIMPCTDKLFFVDLHTGLGPSGFPDLLCTYPAKSWQQKRIQNIFGSLANMDEKNVATGQKVANETNSAVDAWSLDYTSLKSISITLECGTVAIDEMLSALRLEQALYVHGGSQRQYRDIKQKLKDAFYVQTNKWEDSSLNHTYNYMRTIINKVKNI